MGIANAAAYRKGAIASQSLGGRANDSRQGLSANSRIIQGYAKESDKVDSSQSPVVVCAGTTKSGEGCKARPAHGGQFCIGHSRQQEKLKAAE